MAKDKLVDYDSTASGNLDVGGISVAEGMLPSNVNNAIREQMSHLKDFADGTEAINALAVDNLKMDGNTISSTDTNGDIILDPNGTGDIVLDANVGIGTASPSGLLHLSANTATTTLPSIVFQDTGTTSTRLGSITNNNGDFVLAMTSSLTDVRSAITLFDDRKMTFDISNSEAARLDSSGNLLLATTNIFPASAGAGQGIALRSDGRVVSSVSSDSSYFNRNTTDGEIIRFRKDGGTVGSIGTYSAGNTYFKGDSTSHSVGAGDTGVQYNASSDQLRPYNVTSGTTRSDAIDIGGLGARFKDLYLSGGVYLGGTGAANKLDDYEEGTWTPTIVGGLTPTSVITSYTKIGQMVFISCMLLVPTNTDSSNLMQISGLPYTTAMDGGGTLAYTTASLPNSVGIQIQTKSVYFYTSGGTPLTPSTFSNKPLRFSGLYKAL